MVPSIKFCELFGNFYTYLTCEYIWLTAVKSITLGVKGILGDIKLRTIS